MLRLDTALYPPVREPRVVGRLKLDNTHTMHWEEVGNPAGLPLLVLHGGPGGQIKPYYRRLVDAARFRGIFYDQRGCGQSTPFGELRDNNTQALIADIEALRRHLGVERWIVLGGSWGSALALAYAEEYPSRCAGLVITGVFLARRSDLDWWWNGVRNVYPDVWSGLSKSLPAAERGDIRRAYQRRIMHPEPAIHGPASIAMMTFEAQTLDVWPNMDFIEKLEADPMTIASGRMFIHYDTNEFFLRENQLIEGAARLKAIPGAIISGRFDMCTPPVGAWDLHEAWPEATFEIVPCAGHRWSDELIGRSIVGALARLHDINR